MSQAFSIPDAHFRLATFNVEDLFARYLFRENFTPSPDGFTINDAAFQ